MITSSGGRTEVPVDPEPQLDLDLVYALLDADDEDPFRQVVWKAQRHSIRLPPLVLSLLERDGVQLGSGSADELRRARARAARYAHVLARVRATAQVRVLKGSSLARHYPPGVLRPVGDIDLVVGDERDLWRAVGAVRDMFPLEHLDLSLLGYSQRHMVVSLSWPGEDPLLDPNHVVEIGTAALPGNFEAVGVRAETPPDQDTSDLLALAEERFQRPFGPKDAVDVIMLTGTELPRKESLVDVVDSYLLAPEVLELLEYTRGYHSIAGFVDVLEALRPRAATERERRSRWVPPVSTTDDAFEQHLLSGKPAYGMLLRWVPWRETLSTARTHRFDRGRLLCTPVADYLLVTEEVVSRSHYEAAVAELSRLDREAP